MQNLKNFFIAFGVGFVLFGLFALAIPKMIFGDGEAEIPESGDEQTVHTGVLTEDDKNTGGDISNIASEENQSFTALLGGYDKKNGELDALVFIKADKENERFIVAAIPTYLRVPITGTDKNGKATHSYVKIKDFSDFFSKKEAKDMILATVYAMTGMKVDYYAFFNSSNVLSVLRKTGGIYYEVPQDMYYVGEGTESKPAIDLKSGGQVLNAEQVLMLMRYCSYSKSDKVNQTRRAEIHADFVSEAMKQLLKQDDAAILSGVSELLSGIDTNFTADDLKNNFELISSFGKFSGENVIMSLDTPDPLEYSYSQKIFNNYK